MFQVECPGCGKLIAVVKGRPPRCPLCGPVARPGGPPRPAVLEPRRPAPAPDRPSVPVDQEFPYFDARVSYHTRNNRDYRIYFLGDDIFFVYLQTGQHTDILAAGPPLAPLGGIAGAVVLWRRMKGEEAMARNRELRKVLGEADGNTLADVAAACPYSFHARAEELGHVVLAPPNLWHSLHFMNFTYHGLLRFYHVSQGAMTMEIRRRDHVLIAVRQLSARLGEQFEMRIPEFRKFLA